MREKGVQADEYTLAGMLLAVVNYNAWKGTGKEAPAAADEILHELSNVPMTVCSDVCRILNITNLIFIFTCTQRTHAYICSYTRARHGGRCRLNFLTRAHGCMQLAHTDSYCAPPVYVAHTHHGGRP